MQIGPIITALHASIVNQASVATSDPAVDAAVNQLLDGLGPALRVAALGIAEQAAAEARAQLPDHSVDVVLSDGDPTLRITDAPGGADSRATSEDLDARITLRLTPTLKQLVEDAAQSAGDSVNAWVVEALGKRAVGKRPRGQKYDQSFDL